MIGCEIYFRQKLGMTVDSQNSEEIKNAANYWREVLRHFVDIIITLANNDQALNRTQTDR